MIGCQSAKLDFDDLPLGREITDALLAAASSFSEGAGDCHGLDHVERVHRTCLHIGRRLGARLDILSAAALLHDICRREETASQGRICHARQGAEQARSILAALGFDQETVAAVAHAIAAHRYRGDTLPASLEAKILFDADKLDCIGAVGIGRAFLFAGRVGARLHNSGVDIERTEPYSSEDTAFREFKVKLCRVKDRMLTPVGQELAGERHAFMETFFAQLEKEIGLG